MTRVKQIESITIVWSHMIEKILFFDFGFEQSTFTFKYKDVTIEAESKGKLNWFDIAILHVLTSMYYEIGIDNEFTLLTVKKALTANKNARFLSNQKRESTISKDNICKSLEKLGCFTISSINTNIVNLKLLSFLENDGVYTLKKEPALISMNDFLYKEKLVKNVYPISAYAFCNSIHQTIDVVGFKCFIISSLQSKDDVVEFELKDLLKITGLQNEINRVNLEYRKHLISYEIKRKRENVINRRFKNLFLKNYLNNLKNLKVIKDFQIIGGFLKVFI